MKNFKYVDPIQTLGARKILGGKGSADWGEVNPFKLPDNLEQLKQYLRENAPIHTSKLVPTMRKYFIILAICVFVLSGLILPAPAYAQGNSLHAFAIGSIAITDDEGIIGSDETGTLSINVENKEFVEGEGFTTFISENGNTCIGDEVVVKVNVDAKYYDANTLELKGSAEMLEGTSCDTDDLEDTQAIDGLYNVNQPETIKIDLVNLESNGGDTATGDLVILVVE